MRKVSRGLLGYAVMIAAFILLIAALSGYSLRGFTHLKETLEDYFMKYYKEDRDFGGALEK